MNEKEIINFVNNNEWEKMGNWKNSILSFELSLASIVSKYLIKIKMDFNIKKFLAAGYDLYYSKEDYEEIVNIFYNKISEDSGYLEFLYKKLDEISYKTLKEIEDAKDIKKFFSAVSNVTSLGCAMVPLDEAIEKFLKEKDFDLKITHYIYPKRKAEVILEKIDLLKIKVKSEENDVSKDLEEHAKRYGWMNTVNWYLDQFDADYYKNKINKMAFEEAKQELDRLINDSNEEKVKNFLKGKSEKYVKLLDDLRSLIDAKMLNWDVVGISNTKLRKLISQDLVLKSINYNVIVSLTTYEMLDLRSGKLSKKDAESLYKERDNENGRVMIFDGKLRIFPVGNLLSKFKIEEQNKNIKEFSGDIAFEGNVQGIARIIFSAKECDLVKEGDILICPMTNPDFMSAANRAKAIVTDEGGMLCHAAIVSRELGIPCIVGTKIATRVLKMGDYIEVDADKGIVRVLEKGE